MDGALLTQRGAMVSPGSVTRRAAPPTDLRELAGGRRGSGAADLSAAAASAASAAAAANGGPAMLKRAPATLGFTDARRDAPDGGTGNAECRRAGSFAAGAAAAPGPAAAATVPGAPELPVRHHLALTTAIHLFSVTSMLKTNHSTIEQGNNDFLTYKTNERRCTRHVGDEGVAQLLLQARALPRQQRVQPLRPGAAVGGKRGAAGRACVCDGVLRSR